MRYKIPVVSPPSVKGANGNATPPNGSPLLSSPTAVTTNKPARSEEPPITFDAPVVARRDDGWEDVLEPLVFRWMSAVVDERRGIDRS